MKVLLDSCVWGGAREIIEQADHDVVWAGDWSQDPGDEEILNRAYKEYRILITLTKISENWLFYTIGLTPALSDWLDFPRSNKALYRCKCLLASRTSFHKVRY